MSLALRRVAPSLLTRLQVPIQVALYAALFLIAARLVQQFHLPLPANIVGMLMLLALILLRILPLSWVKAGSRWLLAEMRLRDVKRCHCRDARDFTTQSVYINKCPRGRTYASI